MEIVKKNIVSVICGGIALLALIAYFWPVGSMYDDFQGKLKTRADKAIQLRALKAQPRKLPVLDDKKTQLELNHFPNQVTIELVNKALNGLTENATKALEFMVKMNRAGHELLEPDSLPTPLDNNRNYHFRSQYEQIMDYGGRPDPWSNTRPDAGPFNLLDQVLNATPAATKQEVEAAEKLKWDQYYWPKVYLVNNLPDPKTHAEQSERYWKDTANFVRQFHEDRASKFKIYCEKDALTRAPHLTPTETPSAQDIWYAQMTLWVEQDVCQTIQRMNRDSRLEDGQGIQMSPVKRLVHLEIDPSIKMYVIAPPSQPSQAQAQVAAPGTPVAERDPADKSFVTSPTLRACNLLYDVVSFKIDLVLDSTHLTEFLERLQFQRLITVKSMNVQEVDIQAAEQSGYMYGRKHCLQVTLDCEELFMRDWTARQQPGDPRLAPMPPDVQKALGITPAPPAGTANKVAMQ